MLSLRYVTVNRSFGCMFEEQTAWTKSGSGAIRTDRRIAERRAMLIGQMQKGFLGAAYHGRKKTAPEIDPSNATYDEMQQLLKEFLEEGNVEEGAFDFMKEPEDPNERLNYLEEALSSRESQRNSGEMKGYQQTMQAYYAMRSLMYDPVIVETEDGPIEAQYRKGELTSGILGLGSCGNSIYYARYAKDSTAENPVVEIGVEYEEEKKTYSTAVHSVDPKDASAMEMFALLSHWQKQDGNDLPLYSMGVSEGIFDAKTIREFLYEKQNWVQRLEEFPTSEIGMILTAKLEDAA